MITNLQLDEMERHVRYRAGAKATMYDQVSLMFGMSEILETITAARAHLKTLVEREGHARENRCSTCDTAQGDLLHVRQCALCYYKAR